MHCLLGHFEGNFIQLALTKMTKIAVSFRSDTRYAFPTHSCRATAEINVRVVIQNVGKDPEQNLVGCFDEQKINCGVLHCFKRGKIPPSWTWNGPDYTTPV